MFETERLIIRKFAAYDGNDLYEYLSLPVTYLYEPGEPIDESKSGLLVRERSSGNNFFAVELKSERKMIGHLYFERVKPEEFMTWELGYIFHPGYQNKGYCTESSKKIIEYAFQELHAHKVVAYCNPENTASWKVLEKVGMKREGYFRKKAFFRRDNEGKPIWHDCAAYGILDEDHQFMNG